MKEENQSKRRFKLHPEFSDQFKSSDFIPFVLMHVALLSLFWIGYSWTAFIICVSLYVLRVFSITAGYHRYFSHRSFKTSRVFQFCLAFMGTAAWQNGPLWWAAKHREHHRDSDTPADVHSPRQYGVFDAHVGWVYREARIHPDMDLIKDFSKYPELQWLEKHKLIPGLIVAAFCFLIGGLQGLIGGFLLSTVLVYHATFTVNSLNHMLGKQRYLTGDDSRNNGILALITLGEGWHNNHHYYPSSARNGFFWWEIDMTYYMLLGLEKLNIVWDLRSPPETILANEKAPTQKIINKCADYIAEGFNTEAMVNNIKNKWKNTYSVEDIKQKIQDRHYFEKFVIPEMPSFKALEDRAYKKFSVQREALADSVKRAQQILEEKVVSAFKQEDASSSKA